MPEIRRGVAELTGDDAEHLVRVLRAEAGQRYEISDNRDLYLAEIVTARKSVVSFQVMEKLPVEEEAVHTTLVTALFKFDRFEWLVEKATELGVSEIQPFEAVRTERGLAQASIKRRARWERIAQEASEQSRRWRLPVIQPTLEFREAIRSNADGRILLDEKTGAPPMLQLLPMFRAGMRVALLLGPEGGWTDEERTQAAAAGWSEAGLGATILRAETAGVAGLAVVRAWSSANG